MEVGQLGGLIAGIGDFPHYAGAELFLDGEVPVLIVGSLVSLGPGIGDRRANLREQTQLRARIQVESARKWIAQRVSGVAPSRVLNQGVVVEYPSPRLCRLAP